MYTQQEELQRDGLKEILVDCFKVTLKGKYLLKGKDKGTVERDFKGTLKISIKSYGSNLAGPRGRTGAEEEEGLL